MRAADLPGSTKRTLLEQMRAQLGPPTYDGLVAALGEDGLLDQVLASMESRASAEAAAAPVFRRAPRDRWIARHRGDIWFAIGVLAVVGGVAGAIHWSGQALGVMSGIVAGAILGAIFGPTQFAGGGVSAWLGGIGGAIGGGLAGANGDSSGVAYGLVLTGAFVGRLFEMLRDFLKSCMPRF